MVTKIRKDMFQGVSHITNGLLGDLVVDLAQSRARDRLIAAVAADSVAALTDSSTGTAGADSGVIQQRSKLAATVVSGSNLTPKAGLETALTVYIHDIKEIAVKADVLGDYLSIGSSVTSPSGSTNGTLEALTKSVAGASSSVAPVAGVNQKLGTIYSYLGAVIDHVNELCHATGFEPLATINGSRNTIDFSGITNEVGTAVTGAAGQEGVLATALNAELVKLADNIAKVCAKVNAIRGAAAKPASVIVTG